MSDFLWQELDIGKCLSDSFAGEWGEEPNPANARVLRATDINNEGQTNLSGGAPRRISTKKILEKRLHKGDILLEGSGGSPDQPVGRVAFFPGIQDKENFLCSNFFRTLRPDPNVVDPKFLFWKLMWFYTQPKLLTLQQQTTGLINLKFDEYKSTAVAIPEDVVEQQKIAKVIDTLDTAIHQTEAIVEKLKQVKQGLLHDLLTRGVDANGELRPAYEEAPELYQQSPLGWIPKDWTLTQVGSETNIEHGFAFSGALFNVDATGPALLVPGNFHRDGDLYFTDQNTKYFSGKYPAHTILNNDDVLIVMTDLSPMTLILGRTVVLNESFPVLHNQRIGKFVFKNKDAWNSNFFAALMSDDRLRMKIIAEATGTTVRHTSPDRIKSCYIARPSPSEQGLISSRLSAVGNRIKAELCTLKKLQRQKSGLMDDLLTGRVRVTPLLSDATP